MNTREREKERREFEAWGRRECNWTDEDFIGRGEDLDFAYLDDYVDTMWCGWAARAATRESA